MAAEKAIRNCKRLLDNAKAEVVTNEISLLVP